MPYEVPDYKFCISCGVVKVKLTNTQKYLFRICKDDLPHCYLCEILILILTPATRQLVIENRVPPR